MKILAIGDFHGKFPRFLRKVIRKEKPDLIVSIGDYFPFHARKLFFKYAYANQIPLSFFIGAKKENELRKKDRIVGKKILDYLNSLGKRIITITGNHDFSGQMEAIKGYSSQSDKKYLIDYFSKMIKKLKNIELFDYKAKIVGDFVFIGYPRSTFPGHVKSRKFRSQKKKLEKLFKKHRKKKIIFVSHNVPYKTGKLDIIRAKDAHKKAKGKHYGAKISQRLIKKYKPLLCICGHMHENQGKVKMGKTTVINTGPCLDKQYAIIKIIGKKLDIKLKKSR